MAGGLTPSAVLVLRVPATMAPSILEALSVCAERHASAARQTGDKFAHANLMTGWWVGCMRLLGRRRRSGTVYGPPHAVQVELRSVRTHVPEALLQNRARILIRFDLAKIARERAMLCADALELLRIRNKGRDLLPVPQRARPAEQRCRSCMREVRNFEIEKRAPVARPAPAHAGPAQASLQDAEGQDLEILVVRARFLAGKAAAALLLCERTLPGRAVAHSIFRHMNDEDGALRRRRSPAAERATAGSEARRQVQRLVLRPDRAARPMHRA